MGGRQRAKDSSKNTGSRTRRRQGGRQQELVERIRGALSIDLLHSSYPPSEDQVFYACVGHCYVATEAAYHLFARKAGYLPYVLRQVELTLPPTC